MQRVLLLGPDDEARRALHLLLDQRGLAVVAAGELEAARRHLAAADCDFVVATDELARAACAEPDAPPVIAIAHGADVVRELLDAGVTDIIAEPDELSITLALRRAASRPRRATAPAIAQALVGDGAVMQTLRATIRMIAPTRTTVLVLGETGTGKELVARAIHAASPRADHKFVAFNCAAIPAALLESELFGHVRGAFTDAVRDRPGLFEDADGGTVFLDEVGEIPLALQAKLLRALQESEIRRVGDTETIKIDVRVIAATLRDLPAEVAAGRFREDLYYRLAVVPLVIPPLRERAGDIPQLARFFAERHAERHRRAIALTDDAISLLARHAWPGNVRDLENVVERAVVLADGSTIDAGFLATIISVKAPAPAPSAAELSIKKATRNLEQDLIRRALGVTQGNRTNAAKLLEISHRALLYKMKEYGIS
ncbi:MAG TPA: sigma-54 dependent transcriptional regulator [Kofleriaceae bacterium]|nr:sigma-54 dependent transcriptional regulator [Kofleriaceae bacterium]